MYRMSPLVKFTTITCQINIFLMKILNQKEIASNTTIDSQ